LHAWREGRWLSIGCITGGIASHGLPTQEGWDHIYAAVQLLADGVATAIIFSGGGIERVSEAECTRKQCYGCPI
jgi:hypothetical protein